MHVRKWLLVSVIAVMIALAGCSSTHDDERGSESEPGPDGAQLKAIKELNVTAEKMFQHTKADRPELARAELNALANQLERFRFEGIAGVEGMEALFEAIVAGKKEFSAVRYNRQSALMAAGKIRLAVDALEAGKKAMWLQHRALFQNDVKELRRAAADGDQEQLQQLMTRTTTHFSMIRAAVLLSRESTEVYAFESLLNAMSERMQTGAIGDLRALIEHYATLSDGLFRSAAQTAQYPFPAEPPIENSAGPLVWTTTIGTVIVTVLIYAGWRRYRYEMEHGMPVKKERDFED